MPTYFNQKSQTWYCKFYYRDYLGHICQKKKSGFKLQKDAKEWEKTFIRQHEGQPDMTFGDLCTIYCNDMQHRLRSSTMITKENLIRTKLLPYFNDVPISRIEPGTIREWQNAMRSMEPKKGRHYSETYLKSMNNQLSAILNYAVRYYHLSANPCLAAGSMGKKLAGLKQFWRPEEFHDFLRHFPEDSDERLIFALLYYTGIRIGELLALTCQDFHLTKGTVIISKSYRRIHGQDSITPPKTPKSYRIIALPAFLEQLLKTFFNRHEKYEPEERIFPVSRYYVSKYLQEGCEHTGVKKIRIHDLRHSHASLLIEMGCSPLLIAERLGHENVETTLNTYSHLFPHRQKKLADDLDQVYHAQDTSRNDDCEQKSFYQGRSRDSVEALK